MIIQNALLLTRTSIASIHHTCNEILIEPSRIELVVSQERVVFYISIYDNNVLYIIYEYYLIFRTHNV